MPVTRKLKLVLIVCLCTLSGAAHGQWYDYSANVDIMLKSQYVMAMESNLLGARQQAKQQREKADAANAGAGQPPATPLSFTPDEAVAQKTRRTFLDNLSQRDPATARQYGEVLEHQDVRGHFRAQLKALGMDADNLADVVSAYWMTLWAIANKQPKSAITKPAASAVRREVSRSLLAGQRYSAMGSAERQAVADLMIYDTVLAEASYDNAVAAGRDDLVAQLSDAVHRRIKTEGMDLRSVSLSENGFASR